MCANLAPRGNGFTLLEVVVALAIAGMAVVGLFHAGSGEFSPSILLRGPRRQSSGRSPTSPRSGETPPSSKAN